MNNNNSPSTRVVLADDHQLVRAGISALLSGIEGLDVIGEASDGRELVGLVDRLLPDVVITDVSMPVMDGFAAITEIRRRHAEVRLMVLSMHDDMASIQRAVACGACGYLMKDAAPFELRQALRSVMSCGSYFSPEIALHLLKPGPAVEDDLTQRQVEILTLIARGRATKEIAFDLGLSSKTVDVHRSRIMSRLHLNDIANLTRYAVRHGLVSA